MSAQPTPATVSSAWEKDIKRFDLRVPAPLAKLFEHKLSVRLVVRRADVVRFRTFVPATRALVGGIELSVEFLFPRLLIRGVGGGKPEHLRWSIVRNVGKSRAKEQWQAGEGTEHSTRRA